MHLQLCLQQWLTIHFDQAVPVVYEWLVLKKSDKCYRLIFVAINSYLLSIDI